MRTKRFALWFLLCGSFPWHHFLILQEVGKWNSHSSICLELEFRKRTLSNFKDETWMKMLFLKSWFFHNMGTNGFPQNSTTYYMFTRILDELPGKIKSVKILEGLFFHKNGKIWCKKSWLSDDTECTEKDNHANTSFESLRKRVKLRKRKR